MDSKFIQKVQIRITETVDNQSRDFWALFEKFHFPQIFNKRLKDNFLYVISENDKRILSFAELSEKTDNFGSKHLFSSMIKNESFFFDGMNKCIFMGLSLTPFDGVKEYAEAVETI